MIGFTSINVFGNQREILRIHTGILTFYLRKCSNKKVFQKLENSSEEIITSNVNFFNAFKNFAELPIRFFGKKLS